MRTDKDNTRLSFDSSTGFEPPNGAEWSPDAAWIGLERWEALTLEQRRQFPPLAPDFVVGLQSASELTPLGFVPTAPNRTDLPYTQ